MTKSGKYAPLTDWFRRQTSAEVTLTFGQIERILEAHLPRSAHVYDAWWRDASKNTRHMHALAWLENGYRVLALDLNRQSVRFKRT